MIAAANFYAAWLSIIMGLISGTIQGLFFHNENWLGGYGSWKRRMLRLGHISFFGLGFLNLAFAMSAIYLPVTHEAIRLPGALLLIGLVTMPLICYLSAISSKFRHLFCVPVVSLLAATIIFLLEVSSK